MTKNCTVSEDCQIYSFELIVQDLIRKYNFENRLPTRNLIPIDIVIEAIIYRIPKSRESRSVFQHSGLVDKRQKTIVDEPKLTRWLESNPGLTVVEDKVGLNVGDFAHEQLEEMFIEMILTEDPQNAIVPLPYFMNILCHRFSNGAYDYELFCNCGFITFVMKMGWPTCRRQREYRRLDQRKHKIRYNGCENR